MNKLKINIPTKIKSVLDTLNRAGHEAYIVGGCVRDTLLGKAPHDWDIATSATPNQIKETFSNYPQIDTGLKHGTVMIIFDHELIEITTFRVDGDYSDGRRPDNVSFTTSIDEDLSRRDFTINACAITDSLLVDPFGGQNDINNKIIRCVGNPTKRFKEDSLRILRGIRFASILGFSVEDKTKIAMLQYKNLLDNISQERITVEFCKALTGSNVRKIFLEFKDVILHIIPEVKEMIGFNQYNPYHVYDLYEHTIISVDSIDSDIVLRTAMFFHDIGKIKSFSMDENGIGHFYGHPAISAEMTTKILKRMKFSNAHIREITELIKYHDIQINLTSRSVKRLLNKLGEPLFRKLLLIKKADNMAQNPDLTLKRLKELETVEEMITKLVAENACVKLQDLAINGHDLIELGIPKGKEIGRILNQLLEMILNEEVENEREILIKQVKKLAAIN